jgi:GNAT superfamily N-acetyltransferase
MNQSLNSGPIAVSLAQQGDLQPVLLLFDEAVVWLNQRGKAKQWGSEPFSTSPFLRDRFLHWIEQRMLFIGRLDERLAGSLVLNPAAPAYIARYQDRFPSDAFYLEAFVTARSLAGQGIGQTLLQWAERYAREAGKTTLWLDCWADNAPLVAYYQRMGFSERENFTVGDWRGQLFEKRL